MFTRFLLIFIGFISGAGTMSIIYDYKLASLGMYFTNQAGSYGESNIIIKMGITTILLIVCGALIYFKPKQDE